ncbi:sugar fermentation stimulation protein SfsA [Pasteurellaceae bacterium Macca]|nr:sugar fermentation stimulation protein SfsA [Pasteurellaceae bacterium Macca]
MHFPTLSHGTLLRRYQRFLADVRLPSGEEITIHCPNTGAMTGCANEGDRVWFSTSTNSRRKYAHTWELTETKEGHFICVNTQRANQLVAEALEAGWIPELADYNEILPEQPFGLEKSRVDFLLKKGEISCFMEVKSTTWLTEKGVGMFPDAKTLRGQKHLRELIEIVNVGQKAVMFFAILHTGIKDFDIAMKIDPKYAELYDSARLVGVQALAYCAEVECENGRPIAMRLQKSLEI